MARRVAEVGTRSISPEVIQYRQDLAAEDVRKEAKQIAGHKAEDIRLREERSLESKVKQRGIDYDRFENLFPMGVRRESVTDPQIAAAQKITL